MDLDWGCGPCLLSLAVGWLFPYDLGNSAQSTWIATLGQGTGLPPYVQECKATNEYAVCGRPTIIPA
jgi:hypothetical protein